MRVKTVAELISSWYSHTREDFIADNMDAVLIGFGILDVRLLRDPKTPLGTPYLGFEQRSPSGDTPPPLVGAIIPVVGRQDPSQKVMTIGRREPCDIVIEDSAVSEIHCTLERREDGMLVIDQGSTNGTMINGTPLEPFTSELVKSDDMLTVGRHSFKFFMPGGIYEYLRLNLGGE